METELETVFTSIYKDVCLLKLNESFIDINKYIANDSKFSRRLSQLKYILQNYICCMDNYITDIKKSPNRFNSEVPLLKICEFKKSIYPEYLQLLELDDLLKLEKLFTSIKEMHYQYSILFIYILNPTPYFKNNLIVEPVGIEKLLIKIFEFVKYRNHPSDTVTPYSIEKFDNFDYDYQLIINFIKYSFNNSNEFKNYSQFLLAGLGLFMDRNPENIINHGLLNEFLKGEELKLSNPKRFKYFVKSDKELLLNQIKREAFNNLRILGLEAEYEHFIEIFNIDTNFETKTLMFHNPKNVPITFILKLLIENGLIFDTIKFKFKRRKTKKSCIGIQNQSLLVFSKSFNNTYKSTNFNFEDLKNIDFDWLLKDKIDLTSFVESIRTYINLK